MACPVVRHMAGKGGGQKRWIINQKEAVQKALHVGATFSRAVMCRASMYVDGYLDGESRKRKEKHTHMTWRCDMMPDGRDVTDIKI